MICCFSILASYATWQLYFSTSSELRTQKINRLITKIELVALPSALLNYEISRTDTVADVDDDTNS